ncbi:MAG: hypothetical protein J0L92_35450 [Deltaproteobacteria bacterium]|nr:hypothetical protein [Deltaproteobacteria bacterium]
MPVRREVAPTPLSPVVTARRALVACLASLALGALGPGCTNGAGSTCEIDQDCASGLSCCHAGLMRGACQSDCTGVMAPPDAWVDPMIDSGVDDDAFSTPDATSTPDAGSTPDAAAAPDAASTPDAASAPDAASTPDAATTDANVDGGG